ncbi:hypothetical protein NDK43_19475 [Neobacillus pocheonensis]|jgi:hypothetical protein|uniref:Uncharacterized protein n=1 Tax=Neobacillus pocheonensis TaxID=363869 RepID=A0ABT0WDL1_9BACI|nr:hypothetical protein [Neobacillus pocheonensis]
MSPIDLFKAGVVFGLSIYALAKKGFKDTKLREGMIRKVMNPFVFIICSLTMNILKQKKA